MGNSEIARCPLQGASAHRNAGYILTEPPLASLPLEIISAYGKSEIVGKANFCPVCGNRFGFILWGEYDKAKGITIPAWTSLHPRHLVRRYFEFEAQALNCFEFELLQQAAMLALEPKENENYSHYLSRFKAFTKDYARGQQDL